MKTALLVASAIGLALVNIEPVRAASFEFDLEDEFKNFFSGEGVLTFDDSPLTGRGIETAELSELENPTFSFFSLIPSPEFSVGGLGGVLSFSNISDPTIEATFEFNNGELSGIFFEPPSVNVRERVSPERPVQGQTTTELDYTVDTFFIGNKYQQSISGTRTFLFDDGNIIEDINPRNRLYVDEQIIFTTIEPVTPTLEPPTTAVPEPSVIFGIGLAMGCGICLKHKKNKVA